MNGNMCTGLLSVCEREKKYIYHEPGLYIVGKSPFSKVMRIESFGPQLIIFNLYWEVGGGVVKFD